MRDGRIALALRHAVRRKRHLRDVELAMARLPEERLLDLERLIDEVDPVRRDPSVHECARAVVVPAR